LGLKYLDVRCVRPMLSEGPLRVKQEGEGARSEKGGGERVSLSVSQPTGEEGGVYERETATDSETERDWGVCGG
jgi:hypothetical protein